MTVSWERTLAAPIPAWDELDAFAQQIDGTDQVLLAAATGGAKSTLVASLTLPVHSLVALDAKAALTLPRSRTVELPPWEQTTQEGGPDAYFERVREAIRFREHEPNRVILRPHVLDIDGFEAHNQIFRAVYDRRHTLLWIDEITSTGATANRSQPWLRAISARGRTRGIGLWTCTQAPFGLSPGILRRNANLMIFGPLESQDIGEIRKVGIEIAETIPPKTGRFMLYQSGNRNPYKLYVPIPDALKGWKAP